MPIIQQAYREGWFEREGKKSFVYWFHVRSIKSESPNEREFKGVCQFKVFFLKEWNHWFTFKAFIRFRFNDGVRWVGKNIGKAFGFFSVNVRRFRSRFQRVWGCHMVEKSGKGWSSRERECVFMSIDWHSFKICYRWSMCDVDVSCRFPLLIIMHMIMYETTIYIDKMDLVNFLLPF